MKARKFFEQDLANTKPRSASEKVAFGTSDPLRATFGREGLPYFGGLADLAKDQRGATMIEYGLICALIALAIFTGVGELGGGVAAGWGNVHDEVTNAMDPDGSSGGSNAGGNGNGHGNGNGNGNSNAGGNGNGNAGGNGNGNGP